MSSLHVGVNKSKVPLDTKITADTADEVLNELAKAYSYASALPNWVFIRILQNERATRLLERKNDELADRLGVVEAVIEDTEDTK